MSSLGIGMKIGLNLIAFFDSIGIACQTHVWWDTENGYIQVNYLYYVLIYRKNGTFSIV